MNITCCLHTDDYKLFRGIIEQGIDAHLEAFTESKFEEKMVDHTPRLCMDFIGKDLDILLRRLEELDTEESVQWAEDIRMVRDEDD